MQYRLRHLDLDDKMCQQVSLAIFEEIYPREIIGEELSRHEAWEERERVLNMVVIIHLLLAAALWTRLALPRVLERLARPLHVLGLSLKAMQVKGSAIRYRRQQLGVAPLQSLFARCCRPMCTPETIGAYRFGKRLMALDSTMQDVPDTEANAATFARPSNQYGPWPFPQIRLLALSECGSHAIVDATISDHTQAERRLAEKLLPPLNPTWCSCMMRNLPACASGKRCALVGRMCWGRCRAIICPPTCANSVMAVIWQPTFPASSRSKKASSRGFCA